MTVSGSGKVYLTPDIAYVTIGVHTEGYDAKKAVVRQQPQHPGSDKRLESPGDRRKDMQTTNFSIYPQQEYDDQGKPTGEIKYVVDNSVFVTVRDLEMIGDVLNQAVQSGANSISGIQFDVADRTRPNPKRGKSAVENAEVKGE